MVADTDNPTLGRWRQADLWGLLTKLPWRKNTLSKETSVQKAVRWPEWAWETAKATGQKEKEETWHNSLGRNNDIIKNDGVPLPLKTRLLRQ